MSATVARAWDPGSFVVGRRLPARYPLWLATVAMAAIVAACAGSASRQQMLTLEPLPYQGLPAALNGVKLPIATDGVVAIAGRLPERVAGQERLTYGGWQTGERFVAGWGALNGQTGAPPVQIAIRHIDSLGEQAATSGGAAVIADANRTTNISGRLDIGRDGPVVWLRRSDAGYTVAWGRLDNPWLYIVTASTEQELEVALRAFTGAAGTHGGGHSTLR